jgi:hypothetical protein
MMTNLCVQPHPQKRAILRLHLYERRSRTLWYRTVFIPLLILQVLFRDIIPAATTKVGLSLAGTNPTVHRVHHSYRLMYSDTTAVVNGISLVSIAIKEFGRQ